MNTTFWRKLGHSAKTDYDRSTPSCHFSCSFSTLAHIHTLIIHVEAASSPVKELDLVGRNVFALLLLISLGTKLKAGLIESILSHKPALTLVANYLQAKEGKSRC